LEKAARAGDTWAVSKSVTQIGTRYELASADRKLSLPACAEICRYAVICRRLASASNRRDFYLSCPLRVAILHQVGMNIDMQLVNIDPAGEDRSSGHDEKVG